MSALLAGSGSGATGRSLASAWSDEHGVSVPPPQIMWAVLECLRLADCIATTATTVDASRSRRRLASSSDVDQVMIATGNEHGRAAL